MYRLNVLTFVSLLPINLVQAQGCYWPNGSEVTASDNYTSCAADGASQCCASGHACMSNGLCFNPARGAVYRGGCTDSNWSTDACPRFCNDMSDFQAGAAPLAPCPPDTSGQWRWWCGQDFTNVCGRPNENTASFDYPGDASIVKIAGTDNATPTNEATIAIGTASPAPISQTSSPPTSANVKTDGVATFVPIAVGIGVGAPLAMVAIALGFFWWKERKRRIIAERLGYAGQAVAMAKQSYEVEISAAKPARTHSASRSRIQGQGSRSKV